MFLLNKNQWILDIKDKIKLGTYMLFKIILEPEYYVKNYFSKYEHSLIAQIRCGIFEQR